MSKKEVKVQIGKVNKSPNRKGKKIPNKIWKKDMPEKKIIPKITM